MQLALALAPALAALAPPVLAQSNWTKIDLDPGMVGEPSHPLVVFDGWGDLPAADPLDQVNGRYLFLGTDDATGRELYATDGVTSTLLADTQPGPDNGSIFGGAVLGSRYFFTAHDTVLGGQLWTTEGTPATTGVFMDLAPGPDWATATDMLTVGTQLFIMVRGQTSDSRLYVTDGSVAGTVKLKDFGSNGPTQIRLAANPAGTGVVFSASDGLAGQELWTSDGTVAGTKLLADIAPGPGSSDPGILVELGGELVFAATTVGEGRELWTTDGTTAGTHLLADIAGGPVDSDPDLAPHGVIGGTLFFTAASSTAGTEVHATDGSTTWLEMDAKPGLAGSSPLILGEAGGKLIVHLAPTIGSDMAEPHAWDGSSLTQLGEITAGTPYGPPRDFAALGSRLTFWSRDFDGDSFWITDGTPAGTEVLMETPQEPYPHDHGLTVTPQGTAIFRGFSMDSGIELFETDGTAAGTGLLVEVDMDQHPSWSGVRYLARLGADELVFFTSPDLGLNTVMRWSSGSGPVAQDPSPLGSSPLAPAQGGWVGRERLSLLRTWNLAEDRPMVIRLRDDTTTLEELDVLPPGVDSPILVGSAGGFLLLRGTQAGSGTEPWVWDGVAAQAELLADLVPGVDSSHPVAVGRAGDATILLSRNAAGDTTLHRVDGPPWSVQQLLVLASSEFYGASELTSVGDRLCFVFDDGVGGDDVWSTDGTVAGTTQLAVAVAGSPSWGHRGLTKIGGSLYWFGRDASGKTKLWTSDGTLAGTTTVAEVPDGALGEHGLLEAGGRLYFLTKSPKPGDSLWAWDPAVGGPAQPVDPAATWSAPEEPVVAGDRVWFTADDPATGRELWSVSADGSTTQLEGDLMPGPYGSQPEELTVCAGDLLFVATGPDFDRELYRVELDGPQVLELPHGGSGAFLAATAPAVGHALTLNVGDAPAGTTGVLAMSSPILHPTGHHVELGNASWLDPFAFTVLAASTAPTFTHVQPIPNQPSLAGAQVNVQAWFLPPALLPATTSNGLRLVLGS